MGELARSDLPLAARIVTTSPDVTVSTSLGGWVGRREVFSRREHEDVFRAEQVLSPTPWRERTTGQHLELGIAENNLFLNLASLGLAHELFGARLLPVGHALRSVHRPRARCAELCLLPGRALPAGGHAVRHHAGARGRRPPVDRQPADRHQPARPDLVRAGLCRRGRGHAALGVRASAGTRWRLGLSAAEHTPDPPARARDDAGAERRRSWPAATGCCRPSRAPSWQSSAPAWWRPRRSRRWRRCARTSPAPASCT